MTIEELREKLEEKSSEENRFHMEKYMRNQFSFLGVKTPERKDVMKGFLKTYDGFHLEDAERLYLEKEREFKYCAIQLMTKYVGELRHEDTERILSLALTEPWWDTIDSIGPSVLGPMALEDDKVKKALQSLIYEENIWLKRISILFQLKYKEKTDETLLTEAIVMNADTREFFVDKAIGWALREYSKTNPEFVRAFIGQYRLSSLSVRECSRYI
ncbi:DNA alkylation repair protein [Proteiniclasticum sp. C24MP]|uniref:DNA alkylation repair protein n=1 Tax=Proteiniclasticum sp. C24MP TaxID=3374101 RepID=UPI0037548AC5